MEWPFRIASVEAMARETLRREAMAEAEARTTAAAAAAAKVSERKRVSTAAPTVSAVSEAPHSVQSAVRGCNLLESTAPLSTDAATVSAAGAPAARAASSSCAAASGPVASCQCVDATARATAGKSGQLLNVQHERDAGACESTRRQRPNELASTSEEAVFTAPLAQVSHVQRAATSDTTPHAPQLQAERGTYPPVDGGRDASTTGRAAAPDAQPQSSGLEWKPKSARPNLLDEFFAGFRRRVFGLDQSGQRVPPGDFCLLLEPYITNGSADSSNPPHVRTWAQWLLLDARQAHGSRAIPTQRAGYACVRCLTILVPFGAMLSNIVCRVLVCATPRQDVCTRPSASKSSHCLSLQYFNILQASSLTLTSKADGSTHALPAKS
eukprot:5524126-Pleurochrysis_carterae.AAC.1